MIGKTLAHYEVTEHVGAGGMGEVYRARDAKLGRDVALKLLPESFARDAERLSRFEREARLLAALSHPHIAGIYGIEHADEVHFLVLEFIDGEDLAQTLARGALAWEDALRVALRVAEALEAAHEQGIVHRDLKPANIKISSGAQVKVLDFGLAKALESDLASSNLSHSPTVLASSPTVQGVILGTAGYMSPEQARGKAVNRRADIWAFGCVLLEMLTGRQTFAGDTVSDTLAAVLKTEPDLGAVPADTPGEIARLLRRCLDKDPLTRLRDIGEARVVIERVLRGERESAATAAAARPAPSARRRIAWGAGAAVIAVALALAAWTFKPIPSGPPLRKFTLAAATEGGGPQWPVISPDGQSVAYVEDERLWIRRLDQLEPRELPAKSDPSMLFWSPRSDFVAYEAEGKIWKVPVAGGASVLVCDPQPSFTGGRGGDWGEDGRILFAPGSTDIYAVSEQGGDPHPLLERETGKDNDFHEASWLPGGRGVLFVTHRNEGSADTIELLADGTRRVLVQVPSQRLWSPRYVTSGHIIYRRSGSGGGVWALPFSLSKLEPAGEPFLVAAGGAHPSVSREGTLVYLRGSTDEAYQLLRFDAKGTPGETLLEPTQGLGDPRFSPDGRRLAMVESNADDVDIWIHDLTRRTRTRFTFTEGREINPCWSADGSLIYYHQVGKDSIFVRRADGTGDARSVVRGRAPSVSRDGRFIVYHVQGGDTSTDVWYTSLQGDAAPTPFLVANAGQGWAVLSPDGRYLAYESEESGQWEVYVTRFPAGEGKWQVSVDGGEGAVWGRDGRTLYYQRDGCDVLAVDVTLDPALELGNPRVVVDCAAHRLPARPFKTFDVAPDGTIIKVKSVERERERKVDAGIIIVQNWTAEFARR
jgi:serine/threonine-protein kinase